MKRKPTGYGLNTLNLSLLTYFQPLHAVELCRTTLLNPEMAINSIKRKITNDFSAIYLGFMQSDIIWHSHMPTYTDTASMSFGFYIFYTYNKSLGRVGHSAPEPLPLCINEHTKVWRPPLPTPHGRYLCENQAINLNYMPVLKLMP